MTDHGLDGLTDPVTAAVERALRGRTRVVLAVSGGLDSMVLLHAAATVARERIAAVATFDHGTGAAARRAVAHVEGGARARGLTVVVGRHAGGAASEAAWRDARWRFLRRVAADRGSGAVATGHTLDDQTETVAMRVLRGAGARGLAGLFASTPGIVRPLLAIDRAAIDAYARRVGLRWVEDPSNASSRHLRNRVRRHLLPALLRARPSLAAELLAVATRAADWRGEVDAFVQANVPLTVNEGGSLHVACAALAGYDAEVLAILWPAIAARAGVRLDRRGIVRLARFTLDGSARSLSVKSVQLSGGFEAEVRGQSIALRPRHAVVERDDVAARQSVALAGDVTVGGWRFRRASDHEAPERGAAWSMVLPADVALVVRSWRAGDRMLVSGKHAARRVKRFFADARIPARSRSGWPVVIAGDHIVWIPGVRRSDAAMDRPGRPGVHYLCERIDG